MRQGDKYRSAQNMEGETKINEKERLLDPTVSYPKRGKKVSLLAVAVGIVSVALLGAVAVVLGLVLGLGLKSTSSNPASGQPYQHAAVAADAAACSQVGVDVLKKGGSAVDAAVASMFCVGVVNLHSTGIGGGGFMVYYNATSGRSTFIDYREVAPGAATVNMFTNASSDVGKESPHINAPINAINYVLYLEAVLRWVFPA